MKLQICRPNYLRRGGQEGSDERQFLHDGADNARILATPDTGHTCHVALHTCHTLGLWSQSYPLLPRTVKWIQMDVLQRESPPERTLEPGFAGGGQAWELGAAGASGLEWTLSWADLWRPEIAAPAQPGRSCIWIILSACDYKDVATSTLQPAAWCYGRRRGPDMLFIQIHVYNLE